MSCACNVVRLQYKTGGNINLANLLLPRIGLPLLPSSCLAGPRALRKNNYFLEPIREAGSPRLNFGEALPL